MSLLHQKVEGLINFGLLSFLKEVPASFDNDVDSIGIDCIPLVVKHVEFSVE
jgi:hypothetical protein